MIHVIFARRATRDVWRVSDWWHLHRPKNPKLFDQELQAAITLLKQSPQVGRKVADTPGIRRLLLKETGYHLYYQFAPTEQKIVVKALWAVARRKPPTV